MTLREPVELVAPDRLGALHLIAMGGTGMSGIALGYHELGIPVSGCDRTDSPALRHLAELGIETHVGHDPAQLEGVSTGPGCGCGTAARRWPPSCSGTGASRSPAPTARRRPAR